ncbi:glucosamine-6-phosphate deaminase [Geobacillus genomosp. 3]|uniref:Glucosamine-6-phosphate deaminase n=1 Tax=Geobacillus genomosp. 3 TaxID=1921421 RepID=S6A2W1_GEOG3|nr:glucosamine-6-phosphate deaminase [Geobacillus genomosp. 3]AGT32591.1 glucosamine-6-phosphate deaminase [Geobacillus genomosp. 3]
MKLIETADYADMSRRAAEIITGQVREKADAVLGLATGSTMLGVYRQLAADHRQHGTSYRLVRTVNLDEYVGLGPDHPNSYRHYMNEHLFSKLDIPLHQTHVPNGLAADLDEECRRYERLIDELGGIDLQLLGIGRNGHIGFNEPGTPFSSATHVVKLAASTREANARFFPSLDAVPRQAITMGIATILRSRRIVLLASGAAKAEAIARLVEGIVSPELPASALHLHPDVTIIADQAALTLIPKEKRRVDAP